MNEHPAPRQLTHIDAAGRASMVDVGGKPVSARTAVAEGFVELAPATMALVRENGLRKGDVLAVARIAGIQAAKQTQHLVPLCHQIPLTRVAVEFELGDDRLRIVASASTLDRTGVEMEALTAVSVAALTVYDMCKAVDQAMTISGVRLVSKTRQTLPDTDPQAPPPSP